MRIEPGSMSSFLSGWAAPALAYMLVLGLIGVVTKLALRHTTWPAIILWTALTYFVIAIAFVLRGERISLGAGWPLAAMCGLMASGGLILFFVALDRGEVTRVVPLTSAYPIVATIAGVVILGEAINRLRVVGILLVVVGVIVLARSH